MAWRGLTRSLPFSEVRVAPLDTLGKVGYWDWRPPNPSGILGHLRRGGYSVTVIGLKEA
jgi:hypothetical protein